MAQIIKQIAQEGLSPGNAPSVRVSGALGEAVQGLGSAVGSLEAQYRKREEEKENFRTENAYRKLQVDLATGLSKQAESMAPDGTGFHDAFVKDTFKPERDKFLSSVPERLRDKYATILDDAAGAEAAQWSVKAAEVERDQTYKWADGEITKAQDELMTSIAQDPDNFKEYLQRGIDQINASPNTTPYKAERLKSWQRLAEISKIGAIMAKDPQGVLKELDADPRLLLPSTQFSMLAKALTGVESEGNPNAVSSKGATGLMQVMPDTAREIAREIGDTGFNPGWGSDQITDYLRNPSVNRQYGEHYLKKMIRLYAREGGLEAALIAYNGGGARAEAWIKSGFDDSVIPQESAAYYKKVMARLPSVKSSATRGDPSNVTLVFDKGRMDEAKKYGSTPGEAGVNPDLVARVKTSFAALGIAQVKANSGHRNEAHNKAARGAENSQHVHHNAIDIDVTGYSNAEKLKIIQALSANGVGGLGIGSNIIHADLGARRAWGYNRPSGGGAVPAWAQPAIKAHLEGASRAPVDGIRGRPGSGGYTGLTYADREKFIAEANQGVTRQYNEEIKVSAVAKADIKTAMNNEAANIAATGVPSQGFDDLKVAELLGEEAYANWAERKEYAMRMHGATADMTTMTSEQMAGRLQDFEAVPGKDTFLKDQEIYQAVEKQKTKIEKLRASDPDKAALMFDDVKQAYAAVSAPGVKPAPAEVQKFVELMLERQKEFNLKPGSEAPVPREWAMEIGKALSRVPELAGKNLKEVNAGITAQYVELQKMFGPYTDEVILYALTEYHGVGPNTAKVITSYMQAIGAGGDPLKLRPRDVAKAADMDAVEKAAGRGFWGNVKDFWNGERAVEGEPGAAAAELSVEQMKRLDAKITEDLSPADEEALRAEYGDAAVDAARLRKQAQ